MGGYPQGSFRRFYEQGYIAKDDYVVFSNVGKGQGVKIGIGRKGVRLSVDGYGYRFRGIGSQGATRFG